ETFPAALLVARADACPGGQMLVRGEALHLDSNLGQDTPSSRRLNAWNALHYRHRRSQKGPVAARSPAVPRPRTLPENHMGQQTGEENPVMRLDAPLQGPTQRGQLRPQPPAG